MAADDEFTGLVITNRNASFNAPAKRGKVEGSFAAKRSAAFAPSAITVFQFPRQKGWKILLFERLALFL